MVKSKIVVIGGTTASGKSDLALELARKNDGIVINADSLQLYQGLPVLSAQPTEDSRGLVEHKLYGIYSPYDRGNAFRWLQDATEKIREAIEAEKLPIVVGGTGMYLSRLVSGVKEIPNVDLCLRKELNAMYDTLGWDKFYRIVQKVDPTGVSTVTYRNRQRLIRLYEIYKISGKKLSELENIPNNSIFDRKNIFFVNVLPDRDIVYSRCELRFRAFFENATREVEKFTGKYPDISDGNYPISYTIGFLEIKQYLSGRLSREDAIDLAVKNTRHYAKRQYTWFRNQFNQVDFLLNYIPNKKDLNRLSEEISFRILKT
ncbi:MAG: tRNA (adenosine(37)-N6)-dimethylallyltransferase MiaA [Rickettsiales bacterium]|jgi:tRNA dimethylallyltransferase|nr:tRNA (adenosine(37)-N6)-dimethylallyltransferase MiaA [Rickettsiales bacterium]